MSRKLPKRVASTNNNERGKGKMISDRALDRLGELVERAEIEAEQLSQESAANDYANLEQEIARHEARGYAAGIAYALEFLGAYEND